MRLSVRLLGPLEVTVEGKPVRLSGRLRTLLLVLATAAGRVVPSDRLAAAMWGGDLPANPRTSVQTYVARLRAVIGPELIGTDPAGYVLHAGSEEIDALRFLELLDASKIDDALALWRGNPFEGCESTWLEKIEAPRLVERYLSAVEQRIDLEVAQGRYEGLVADLTELTNRYPLRESLWVRLLVVLDRSGRTAEALDLYETIRRKIADELGADPGPQLQAIHADLLSNRAPVRPPPADRRVVPRQLPGDIAGFVGREEVLARLDGLLADATPPVVAAIGGAAGIGKTALAVHWAHRVADRFPDGQLYVNLRGFDPSGPPRQPAEVLRGLLDSLGVAPHQVPADVEAQAGLYRSLLADRRMLLVLDNARDAEQVRPLLPGAPDCLAVVTSRDAMAGLIAAEGAVPLLLEVLSPVEARQLLARRLGPQRTGSDPDAVEEIVARCASLPLALAVVAARAALRPDFPLRALAAELARSDGGRLDVFAGTDPSTDVRAVFSWSYRTLSAGAARLFRVLGPHPGPDIATAAVVSLAGLTPAVAKRLLSELAGAHLVTEHVPGRYAFHDLFRAYAVEQAGVHDSEVDRRAAVHRMLDHYLHSAYRAAVLLYPQRGQIALAPARRGVRPEEFADHREAMDWFAGEHSVLLGVLAKARADGFDTHTWQLAWALMEALDRRGHRHDIVTTQLAAIEATQRLGEHAAQAQAHRDIARAYGVLGRLDDAHAHLASAFDLAAGLGDHTGLANTHRNIARILELQGRVREAIEHTGQAMALYCRVGDQVGQARALNSLGWFHGKLGRHEQALAFCEQALRLHREVGNQIGQAVTLDSLGVAHHHLGHVEEATACYHDALDVLRDLGGDLSVEAEVLTHLGATHRAAGDIEAAGGAWRRALAILDGLDDPGAADQVKAKLAALKPR